MISEGVAEFLTSMFDCLPANLMETLQIISLFGNQVEVSTINQMNSGQRVLPFDMVPVLDLAVAEGMLEKAGPIYAFSHDLIHQTLYKLIPAGSRCLLHKLVGDSLLSSTNSSNHTMHLLAVDQINLFCKDGELDEYERSAFALANTTAAKYAMAASSFEKGEHHVFIILASIAFDVF